MPRHSNGPQVRVGGFYHTNWNTPLTAAKAHFIRAADMGVYRVEGSVWETVCVMACTYSPDLAVLSG